MSRLRFLFSDNQMWWLLSVLHSHRLYKITNKASSVLARAFARSCVRAPVHQSSSSYPSILISRIVCTHPYVRPSADRLLLIRSSFYRELSERIYLDRLTSSRKLAPETNSLSWFQKKIKSSYPARKTVRLVFFWAYL